MSKKRKIANVNTLLNQELDGAAAPDRPVGVDALEYRLTEACAPEAFRRSVMRR